MTLDSGASTGLRQRPVLHAPASRLTTPWEGPASTVRSQSWPTVSLRPQPMLIIRKAVPNHATAQAVFFVSL